MGTFPRKVLISPGFGAGWSTWNEEAQFTCEYQPIIEFLEGGGKFVEKPYSEQDRDAPQWENFEEPGASVLERFCRDLEAHKGKDEPVYFYLGGARDLIVETVHAPYRVEEYDGSESLRFKSDDDYID